MKRQRKFAIAGVTGAMLVGAGTGVVLNLPGSAGASSAVPRAATIATDPPSGSTDTTTPATTPDTTSATTPDTTTPASTPATGDTPAKPTGGRGEVIKAELDKLVAAGTITQAQEDAIIAGIEAARPTVGNGSTTGGPAAGGDHGGRGGKGGFPGMGGGMGHGGPGFGGFGGRGAHLDAAATALGITADELQTELEAGKTIADVATEKGVDVQKVIDAIVATETANITEQVTNEVNGVKPTPPTTPTTPSTDDSTPTTTG